MTPPSSATNRLQPFSISSGIRARNFASRKLLASSSPVEAQLFIQTRAISSYSSARAGRIAGGGICNEPRKIRKTLAVLSRGFLELQSKAKTHDEARSKRSRFITLLHAATKPFTNFSFESAHA